MDRDPPFAPGWLDQAVASASSAELADEVMPLVRPRFIAGVARQRPRLSVQLRVARRNGRLVLRTPDAYCLLDPPAGTPARSGTLATWIEENWPFAVALGLTVLLWAVPLLTLLVAVLFRIRPLPSGLTVLALALIMVGLAVYVTFQAVWLVRSVVEMVRSFGDRRHLDRILAHHWSVRLLHVTDPRHLDELIERVSERIGGKVLLVELSRVTTTQAREALRRRRDAVPLEAQGGPRTVLVVGARARLSGLQSRRGTIARGLAVFSAAVVAGLLVSAWQVADVEHEGCSSGAAAGSESACFERPARFVDALYWLTGRLLSFDADGFKAVTWEARLLGVSWTVFGLVILGAGLGLLFQEALKRNQTAGVEIVERFNAAREAEEREAKSPAAQEASAQEGPAREQVALPATPGSPEHRHAAGYAALWFVAGLAVGALLTRRSGANRSTGGADRLTGGASRSTD